MMRLLACLATTMKWGNVMQHLIPCPCLMLHLMYRLGEFQQGLIDCHISIPHQYYSELGDGLAQYFLLLLFCLKVGVLFDLILGGEQLNFSY